MLTFPLAKSNIARRSKISMAPHFLSHDTVHTIRSDDDVSGIRRSIFALYSDVIVEGIDSADPLSVEQLSLVWNVLVECLNDIIPLEEEKWIAMPVSRC